MIFPKKHLQFGLEKFSSISGFANILNKIKWKSEITPENMQIRKYLLKLSTMKINMSIDTSSFFFAVSKSQNMMGLFPRNGKVVTSSCCSSKVKLPMYNF